MDLMGRQKSRGGITDGSWADRGRIVPDAWRLKEEVKQKEESEGETSVACRWPRVYREGSCESVLRRAPTWDWSEVVRNGDEGLKV